MGSAAAVRDSRIGSLSREINRATAGGDIKQARRLMDDQLSEVMHGLMVDEFVQSPGDPVLWTDSMRDSNSDVALRAVALQFARKEIMGGEILKQNNWSEIQSFGQGIVDQFKERNKQPLIKERPGMTMEERVALSQQLVPIEIDPNELANWRQRLVKLDNQMKTIGSSVYTDPRTSRIAKIIATETSPTSPGYAESGEQDIIGHMPLHERMLMPIRQGVEEFVGTAANFGYGIAKGLEQLGVIQLDSMTGGNASSHYNGPTAWVQDADGSWYHNGGKVGAAELYAGVWNLLTGQLIDQEMADYSNTKAIAEINQSGFRSLTTGIAQFYGGMRAFTGIAGPIIGMATKGLGWLATGGRSAVSLERASKITKMLVNTAGNSAGMGIYEGVQNGHIEGYGAAFLNGAIIGAPMTLIGAMGRSTERLLRRTDRIPKRLASMLSGAAEGTAFAMLDWKPVWNFIQDPNPDTRSALVRHVAISALGMAAVKGATGHGLADLSPFGTRMPEPKLVEKHETAKQAQKQFAGRKPDVSVAAKEEAEETAAEIRVQQHDLDRPEEEQKVKRYNLEKKLTETLKGAESEEKYQELGKLLSGEPEPEPGTFTPAFRERVRAVRDMPEGPEKRAATRALQAQALRSMPEMARRSAEAIVEPEAEQARELFHGRVAYERLRGKEDVKLTPEQTEMMTYRLGAEETKNKRESDPELAQAKAEMARESFLEEGIDPLESKVFRDLPEKLQTDLAKEQDPVKRRQLVLDYKSEVQKAQETSEVTEAELQELGLEAIEKVPGEAEWVTAARKTKELREEYTRRIMAGESKSDLKDLLKKIHEATDVSEEAYRNRKPQQLSETPLLEPGEEGYLEARQDPSPKTPGQPASFRMVPELEVEGVPGTPLTRASDVILEAQGREGDLIRVPIRQGTADPYTGITKKGLKGFWNSIKRVIGLAHERDTVTVTHEFSHEFDKVATGTVGGANRIIKNKKLMDEFLSSARNWYPGFDELPPYIQRAEAWAEFWARWLLDDPTLKHDVPNAYTYLARWLTTPGAGEPYLEQLLRFRKVLRNYRDEGSQARVRAARVMHDDPESAQELADRGVLKDTPFHRIVAGVKRAWNKIRQLAEADNHLMKKAIEEHHKIRGRTPQDLLEDDILISPVRLMDTLRMLPGKVAERFLMHGTTTLSGDVNWSSLDDIIKFVGKAEFKENFLDWLHAKQNIEVHNQGKPILPSITDSINTAKKLQSDKFEEAAHLLRVWNDKLVDYGVEAGLWSHEQGVKIKNSYTYYMPMYRAFQDRPRQSRPGRGVAERGTGIKEREGSDLEIRDPIESFGEMARSIITKAHQNMVMKSLVLHELSHEGVGGIIRHVARDKVANTHPLAQIMDALKGASDETEWHDLLDQMGDIVQSGEIGSAITLFSQSAFPKGSKPVIAFTPHFSQEEIDNLPTLHAKREAIKMNGKVRFYETDVDVYETLMGVDVPPNVLDKFPGVAKIVGLPVKATRLGAVALSPAFSIRNLIRGTLEYYAYSKNDMKYGIFSAMGHVMKAFRELKKGTSEESELFKNLGLEGSTFFGGEMTAGRTASVLLGTNKGFSDAARRIVYSVHDRLGISESAARFAEFKGELARALKEGKDDLEARLRAAEGAKNLPNFTRAGTLSRVMNRMAPFFSASIAGSSKFVMALNGSLGKEVQRRAFMRGIYNITLPALALWWWNKDKKWYKELPEWERFNYLHVDMEWLGIKSPLRIPLPFELGKIFATVPTMVMDQFASDDPISASHTMWDVVTSFVPSQWNASILSLITEAATNHDFFTGRDIVPAWMKVSRLPKDQQNSYTRWYGKMLSEALGFVGIDTSPMMQEHLVNRFTGGLVGRSTDFFTSLAKLAGLAEGETGARDVPFAGTLFSEPFRQSRSIDRLFQFDRELEQRMGSARAKGRQPAAADHQLSIRLQRTKDAISTLMDRAREGTMARSEANQRAADLARAFLDRVK